MAASLLQPAHRPESVLLAEYEDAIATNNRDKKMRLMTEVMSKENYQAIFALFTKIDQRHGQKPTTLPTPRAIDEPFRYKEEVVNTPKRKEPQSLGDPRRESEQDKALKEMPMFDDLVEYIQKGTRIAETTTEELAWLQQLSEQLSSRDTDRVALLEQLREKMKQIAAITNELPRDRAVVLWGALLSMAYARGHISRDELKDLMTKEWSTIYTMENRAATRPSDWI